MKNNQKGFMNIILAGALLVIVVIGGYFLLAKKSVPVAGEPNQPSVENSEAQIISSLKTNWQSFQTSFNFRPGHPGTVDWGSPVAVQFIGNSNLFIVYEDGYIANTALLNYKEGKFTVSESFPNHGLFTFAEWQNLVNKYGDPSYAVSSYSINAIRNNEIVSFSELTKVPENVFVKNFPIVSQSATYTYKNHGFTIELPTGFVPTEEEAEGGPYLIISLPTGGLSYTGQASWHEKYAIPQYTFIKDEKIGETTFRVYEYEGREFFKFYWFQRGAVGYEFHGPDDAELRELLKTFRFVGWAE